MKTRPNKGKKILQSEETKRRYIKFSALWTGLTQPDRPDVSDIDKKIRRFAEFTQRFVGHIGLGYDPVDLEKFRRARSEQIGFFRRHKDLCQYYLDLFGSWCFSEEAQTHWPKFDRRDLPTELQCADPMLDETMLALYLIADQVVKFVPHDEPDGRLLPDEHRAEAAVVLGAVDNAVTMLAMRKPLRKLKKLIAEKAWDQLEKEWDEIEKEANESGEVD